MRREDLADADCGIAQALGVVGDWWTVLILREIAGSVTRFDAIQQALGISRRALTERLGLLVEHGLLERRGYSEHPPRSDYLLTAKGEGFLPVLVALQEFGDRHVMGDGRLTATATSGAGEARRVRALAGTRVPALSLPGHRGSEVSLRPEHGWRVVYLFPGAFAPRADGHPPGWDEIPGAAGCTLESTTYAARHPEFARAGADVVGVSTQRPDQQAAYARHARLPFTLASDEQLRLATALRLPLFRAGGADRLKRCSLLLDATGVVRHIQVPISDPAGSVDEMLAALREWRSRPSQSRESTPARPDST
ncbi:MAG TPA: winged helix-turn-helix transcriptional regulator [Nocardioidaceae bacterium]|nr:winged helix-turn-helix transcriptional regulator [Nocardioidaceae bacterium]